VRELLSATQVVRSHIWARLDTYMRGRDPWPPELLHRMEDLLHTFIEHYVANVGDALEHLRADLLTRSDELDAQRAIVRELGAPTIPVHDGILVLPLVGAIDSDRALQLTENLLEAIAHHQADIVIIDITGVPMVDTGVANYMIQAARAAHLIGAQVVLVGLGSRIAQTIVQLGVDLSAMTTLSTLQEGLAHAYRQRGIRLVS
jgi:rsbT co-antagonist protein RsbR